MPDSAATTFVTSPPTSNTGSPGTSNVLFNAVIGPAASIVIDLTDYDMYILPGKYITISATGSASASTSVGANWQEDW